MCTQTPLDLDQIRKICDHVFSEGEYTARTLTESGQLQKLGFVEHERRITLPGDIELLDLEIITHELNAHHSELSLLQLQLERCVESTNQELIALGDAGNSTGTILAAELQIGGRGRFGRTWYSPVGRNIAVSYAMELSREVLSIGTVSLIAGIAVASALQELGIEPVTLKWPNDILLADRKAGGVLVELVQARPPYRFVIGVGLNTGGTQVIRKWVDYPLADVLDYCDLPMRNKLIALITRHLYVGLRRFEIDGFRSFSEQWNEFDALQNKVVSVASRASVLQGTARGVKPTGELCIECSNGEIHHVVAGEVSLRPPT